MTDFLTPPSQTERITFRRFDGYALAEASENDTEISSDDVWTIKLKVNPEEIAYSKPKITQKVQTAHPKRFVVFEWGTDLTVINLAGNTGNMVPSSNPSSEDIFENDITIAAGNLAGGSAGGAAVSGIGSVLSELQEAALGVMSYFEILEMSPKYRLFKDLQDMYETFDADSDILTMEMGNFIYRGYFSNFNFTQNANNPWNWKYNIEFIVLDNLSQKFKDENNQINASTSIDKGA